jgi:hypothetical protein
MQRFESSAAVDRVAAFEIDASDNLYLSDGSITNFKREQLRPTFNGLFSLDIHEPVRAALPCR